MQSPQLYKCHWLSCVAFNKLMLISHEQSFRMLSVTCRCILYTLVSIVFMGCHFGMAEGGKNHSMLTPKK